MAASNEALKARARESLEGKWGTAIGVMLIVFVLNAVASAVVPVAGGFFVGAPLMVGLSLYFLRGVRRRGAEVEPVFTYFKLGGGPYINVIVAALLAAVFVSLWSLLLIVPGIVAFIAYSQTTFLLCDDPQLDGLEAIRKSKQLMHGHKARLFWLWVSFVPWFFVVMLTLGLAALYVAPYFYATLAAFYDDLRPAPGPGVPPPSVPK